MVKRVRQKPLHASTIADKVDSSIYRKIVEYICRGHQFIFLTDSRKAEE